MNSLAATLHKFGVTLPGAYPSLRRSSLPGLSLFVLVVIAIGGIGTVWEGVATADPQRELPNYDGRGNEDADVSWGVWVPRIALSPLYLVNEFVLRRPIGALVTVAERQHWADNAEELFRFGEGGKSVLVPTVLFDFGLLPSVGLYYSGDDIGADGNNVRLHGATWGPKWINVTAADRYLFKDRVSNVQLRFEFKRSEDNLFFGIGPDVTDKLRSRYGLERREGLLSYRQVIRGESNFGIGSGIHAISFVDGTCCGDPSVETRVAAGELPAPPGFETRYTSLFERADITLDTRSPRPAPGTGVYLHAIGDASIDLSNPRAWIHYGGVLGGALDLNCRQRTLKLQVALDFVDALRGDVVPFNEYLSLGGQLPGFVTGWMTGRSTAAAQLAYTWPIWLWLDGQTRASVGNAFGNHLDGFALKKLRLSGDIGVTTNGARDQAFEVVFGLGTETLDQGAHVTSVRVTFGARKGF